MKRMGVFKAGALLLACLGMVVPTPVLQAAVVATMPQTKGVEVALAQGDVALRPGGVLVGQVVDGSGKPLTGTRVSLWHLGREIASTVTDGSGRFTATGLRGGQYEIVAGPARGKYRVWAPNTAPPSAKPGALVMVAGERVRGQEGPFGYWLSNPWVLAGLVAVAIAVPVAAHNHKLDNPSSP